MVVDTACSSSLVAGWTATSWLKQGVCEQVVTMGENLLLDPRLTVQYCQTQMMSPDGLCAASAVHSIALISCMSIGARPSMQRPTAMCGQRAVWR